MRWGLGIDLVTNGGKLARSARIYFDLVEAGGDPEEIDEAAEMLEFQIKRWWRAADRFQASSQREIDQAIASRFAARLRRAMGEAPWNPRRQAEDVREGVPEMQERLS